MREEIRDELARDKAVDELEPLVSEAASELQALYNEYGIAAVEAQENKQKAPKPPAKLVDLSWLAEKYGLTYENKMEPLTVRELVDTVVGKAEDAGAAAPTSPAPRSDCWSCTNRSSPKSWKATGTLS